MLIVSRGWISLFKELNLTKPQVGHEGEVRTCGQPRCYEMGRLWHENVLREFGLKKKTQNKQRNRSIAKHEAVLCRTASEIWSRYFSTGTRWFNASQVLKWFSFLLRATCDIFTRATKFLGSILGGTRRFRLFMSLTISWLETTFLKNKVSFIAIKKLRISTDEVWSCLVKEMLVTHVSFIPLLATDTQGNRKMNFHYSKQLNWRNYVLLSL